MKNEEYMQNEIEDNEERTDLLSLGIEYPDFIDGWMRGYIERRVCRCEKDADKRRDVIQKALIAMCDAEKRYSGERGVKKSTYLISILNHQLVTHTRSENRKKRTAVVFTLDEPVECGSEDGDRRTKEAEPVGCDGEKAIDELGFRDEVRMVFKRLTPVQRKVCLAIMRGDSQSAIAREMFGLRTTEFQRQILKPIRAVFKKFRALEKDCYERASSGD